MKIERLSTKKECKLWEFFKQNLPPSLRASRIGDGYGEVCYVEVKNRNWASYIPFTGGIATIWYDTVELRHPEYYSDFEEICRKYEAQTGKTITFRYWEST